MTDSPKAQGSRKRSDLTEDQRKIMFAISGKCGVDPRTARAYLLGAKTGIVAKYAIEHALVELGRPELVRKDVTT